MLATEKAFAAPGVVVIKEVLKADNYELIKLENYKYVSELTTNLAKADAVIVCSDKMTGIFLDL